MLDQKVQRTTNLLKFSVC